tara:strand:- start:731 stop:1861 length:1131 start_codon:yes stop_codon:yes gene_type:complete
MGIPKKFLKNVQLKAKSRNHARRLELWEEGWNASGTFVPKGVLYEDMDRDFIKFVEDELSVSLGGEKVPVFFLTMQRWAEFARTWQFTDKNRNVQIPFVTIVRHPDIQFGTNPVTQYTIPQKQRFDYMKVPNYDGDGVGVDVYKIPQPIAVNLTYEVRFFSYRMREINKFNKAVMQEFQSRQKYINCNGHYFPIILENIGDESTIDQFEKKRFYLQSFEMQMLGYIMDEEDYEVTPAIKRVVTLFETEPKIVPSLNATDGLDSGRRTDESTINFQWNVGDSLDGTSITTIDNSTKVIDSALLTTMTFDNLRDCPEISDDCPVGGPRLYISLDEGATFTSTNLPLQVLPGYYLYIRGNVINVSLAATLTLHGYINKV